MSYQVRKRGRYIFLAASATVLAGSALAWLGGRSLISAAYEGRSLGVLNALISGQAEHPVGEYFAAFDRIALLITLFVSLPLATGLLVRGIASEAFLGAINEELRGLRAALCRNWAALLFASACILLAFGIGLTAGMFKLFPYEIATSAATTASDWLAYWRHYLRLRPDQYLSRSLFPGEGVVKHDPLKAYPGVTFLSGLFGGKLGMKLVAMDGAELHHWQVPFDPIWQATDAAPPHDWDAEIHGAYVYPNGDVVFNVEHSALVKIDRCSNLLWSRHLQTHHSISLDDEGNLWVPGRAWRSQDLGRLPYVSSPFIEESLIKVSPDGKVLAKLSIIDLIYKSGYEAAMFADRTFKVDSNAREITHLNDIEVLNKSMASAFPLFKVGDLLLSMRNLNLVMVIDPVAEQIKWSATGPFLRQHDPDFLRDGTVAVFDNRHMTPDGRKGLSRIISMDPVSRAVRVLYEGTEQNRFYTSIMGKQQQLPNGNILITESRGGRAFEVTPNGETVWSLINRWDEDWVATISEASRYPASYAAIGKERCP